MNTVAEIKEAIDHLTAEEKSELMALLNPVTDDDWDRQMRADARAGKLDHRVEEARQEAQSGVLRDYPKPRNQ